MIPTALQQNPYESAVCFRVSCGSVGFSSVNGGHPWGWVMHITCCTVATTLC